MKACKKCGVYYPVGTLKKSLCPTCRKKPATPKVSFVTEFKR